MHRSRTRYRVTGHCFQDSFPPLGYIPCLLLPLPGGSGAFAVAAVGIEPTVDRFTASPVTLTLLLPWWSASIRRGTMPTRPWG